AIAFARREGLEIAVRGGGHNYPGYAVCEGGVVVDLTKMRAITVDPAAKRVRCGGGTTWADLDAATQEHALAGTGGFISHTVVGWGSPEQHATLVQPILDTLPPLFHFVTPIPYTEVQKMLDESAPWGILAYEKAIYLDELTDGAIAVIADQMPRKASPLSLM